MDVHRPKIIEPIENGTAIILLFTRRTKIVQIFGHHSKFKGCASSGAIVVRICCENPPIVAVIVTCPGSMGVIKPAGDTIARQSLEHRHVASEVTFLAVPSLYKAIAESCLVSPASSDERDGVIMIDST
jgi:hypothetical protein